MSGSNNYIDDYIDDDIDDNTVNSKTNNQQETNQDQEINNQEINNQEINNQEIEKLLGALGGLDESTLNKLAEMKDMTDFNNLDFKKLRQMFSKMNIDKNKLKSLKENMEKVNGTTQDSTPLTREELRKKLREKTNLMRKTRTMK